MMLAKLSSSRIMMAASRATSVPARPMATPMSAFFRAGASFTPSPVTATMSFISLRAETTCILCSGATLAKITSCGLPSSRLEVVLGHVLQVGAGDHPHGPVAAHDADAPRDGLGRQAVVAGHHDDADAGGEGVLDGLADLGPRRVDHADQAEEGELGLDRVGRVVGQVDRQVALGDRPARAAPGATSRRCARRSARAARRSCGTTLPSSRTLVQRGMVSDGAPLT